VQILSDSLRRLVHTLAVDAVSSLSMLHRLHSLSPILSEKACKNINTLVCSLMISLDTKSVERSANLNIKAGYLATDGSLVILILCTNDWRYVSVFFFCSMSSSLNSMTRAARNSFQLVPMT